MSTETVCQEADRIVYGDREKTYDHPARNFERTALLWNSYLMARYGPNIVGELDVYDVARMMSLLKLARQIHKHSHDNLVDQIGYIACEAKIRDYETR